MSTYIAKNIGPGETVRYTAKLSLCRYCLYFIGGTLLGLPVLLGLITALFSSTNSPPPGMTTALVVVLLFVVVVFVWPFIARSSTELAITDKRLIVKYGLLSTHSIEIRFNKIETVRVSQGLVGKIFKYGDVIVTGTGSTFDPIRSIKNPMGFRAALSQAMEVETSNRESQLRAPPASATG